MFPQGPAVKGGDGKTQDWPLYGEQDGRGEVWGATKARSQS